MRSEIWGCVAAVLLTLSTCQAKPPRMVNLFLPGGTSHHMISNALAGAMRGRGWRTTAILADFDARSLAAKGLLDRGLEIIVFQTPPKSSEQYQAMLSEVQDKPNELIKLHTQHFDSLCRNLLEDSAAMEALRSLNPDLLLLDSTFSCGHAVAVMLRLPYVQVSPVDMLEPFSSALNAVPYSPAVHSFIGAGFAHPLTFKERAINALVSPLVLRLGLKLTTAKEQRLAQDFNLSFVGPEAASHSARLILINSAVGLGPIRSLPPRVKLVGPLLVHGEPEPLPTALERIMAQAGPQGVVYASLGTTFRAASCDTIQGLAGALALLNRTAIWQIAADSLPVGCPLGSLDLPPSVHIMPWVPQSDLLGHPQLKAMLTHGGANSLLEAAYTGTPLVCMPLAADQYDGCAKAAQGGWGQVLKKAELRAATAPLLAAMLEGAAADGSQFAQRAAHASALLRAHPRPMLQQAADWIEYALALPPGTDLLDPAMLMPWWRRQCLDVYALAALVAVGVLIGAGWLSCMLCRAMWRRACGKGKQD